jgi:RecB family exonuclease
MFLSQSEIATWTRCPRKWFIEYYLGYQPAGRVPYSNQLLGTRIHTALEAQYGYDLDALAVLRLLYGIEIQANFEYETELKAEQALAMIMVSGYREWAEQEGQDADLQVVATEADLQVPLPGLPEVVLRARMDQVVREISTGVLRFLDHKTCGTFEAHEVLELNPQFRFYGLMQFLAAGHGEPIPGMQLRPDRPVVMGGIMNSLRRVKRTSASKPPYYQRDKIRLNLEVLHSTMIKVRQVALEIYNARGNLDAAYSQGGELAQIDCLQRSLLRPVQVPHDCIWSCPASRGLCIAMDDGSDWTGILAGDGFVRADPYARYSEDPLRSIRDKIASP